MTGREISTAVGTLFLFSTGVVVLFLSQKTQRSEQEMSRLVVTFSPKEDNDRYVKLFQEAKELQKEVASQRADHLGFMGGAVMSVGFVLFCWTIDRARLSRKVLEKERAIREPFN